MIAASRASRAFASWILSRADRVQAENQTPIAIAALVRRHLGRFVAHDPTLEI